MTRYFSTNTDIICFSHLRWNFVYQRPQHLMSRFARHSRVFVIEEPVFDVESGFYSEIVQQPGMSLWVVTPHLVKDITPSNMTKELQMLIDQVMLTMKIEQFIAWYYSPMALTYSNHLKPQQVVYDCMDELSAFRFAPPALKQYESMLLAKADVVFTGGHHLFEAKQYLHDNIYPIPSSIDKEHFAQARQAIPEPGDQAGIPKPRIGFYGVVDERFNVSLLKDVATLHPQWHFVVVGPVVKIDPSTLPRMANIHFLGAKDYKELPAYLSGWNVAMMPFALNESTKYISPTKTPEYLAGGKPVVSTSIRDVVIPYGKEGMVQIADTVNEFCTAIKLLLSRKNHAEWLKKTDAYLSTISWDKTFEQMATLMYEGQSRKKNKLSGNNKQEAYV